MNSSNKVKIIDTYSVSFPKRLKDIPKPPERLYCLGDLELLDKSSIAVVGSRKFTIYGKNVANLIGKILGNAGIAVVSGLAYGIDSFAHEGVLEADGKPIAVLGTGIEYAFRSRRDVRFVKEVSERGLLISEYPPLKHGTKYTFPERNRLISGLSEAVIVVEAGAVSGALITARFAAEQGKSVYAVPGNINSQFSLGTNLLIRDGAIPLVIISDVLSDLGFELSETVKGNESNSRRSKLGEDELEIIDLLSFQNPVSVDEISRKLKKSIGKINAILTVLEIKGEITSYNGKIFSTNH